MADLKVINIYRRFVSKNVLKQLLTEYLGVVFQILHRTQELSFIID